MGFKASNQEYLAPTVGMDPFIEIKTLHHIGLGAWGR